MNTTTSRHRDPQEAVPRINAWPAHRPHPVQGMHARHVQEIRQLMGEAWYLKHPPPNWPDVKDQLPKQ